MCVAGLHPIAFALAVAVFGAIMHRHRRAARARAVASGDFVAALFLLGFVAWSAWYVGGWLMRNKPQRYEPEHVPPQLLP